jgi:hypothetical protein
MRKEVVTVRRNIGCCTRIGRDVLDFVGVKSKIWTPPVQDAEKPQTRQNGDGWGPLPIAAIHWPLIIQVQWIPKPPR